MKTWKNSPQKLLIIHNQQLFSLPAWLPKRPILGRNRNFIGSPCLLSTISLLLATNRDLYDWGWAWPLLTIVFPKWTWHKNWHLLPKLWETSYFFWNMFTYSHSTVICKFRSFFIFPEMDLTFSSKTMRKLHFVSEICTYTFSNSKLRSKFAISFSIKNSQHCKPSL